MTFNVRTASLLALIGLFASSVFCARPAHADAARKIMIHRVLCDIYTKQHDSKGALGEFNMLNQLAPNDPQMQYNFGLFLVAQKEHGLAIVHFKKAAQLDPSVSDYWGQLGNEYEQVHNYSEAAESFHKAGARYAPQEQAARQYLQQLKSIQDYNKQVKEREEQ